MCPVVVGLDLAGVPTRPTGFCILNVMEAKTCQVYSDIDIRKKTADAQPDVIAIDAPLYMPPGRVTLTQREGNHLRESDRALLKIGIKVFPPTLGPMRILTERGIQMRIFFEGRGFKVIEAYPGGAQDILDIPRKKHGLEKLREGLQALGIHGLENVQSDHELDAATAAYIGKLFLEGETEVYGDPDAGIILPKKKKWF